MRLFSFINDAIDPGVLREPLEDPGCGGYAAFEGWVRNHNEGRQVRRLEYEAYEALAVKEGERIVREAIQKFGIARARCVHRVGELQIGEMAVWVGASAPHRDEAFSACRYIIDEVKSRIPIWKKEHYVSGDSGWVNCERCASHAGHSHPTHEAVPIPDYARQTILKEVGETGQARLASSSVLVIGAGGLGSPALSYLAAAGVGTIGIVDGDALEASNLHRQVIYELKDAGKPKVELAAKRLSALNPAVRLICFDKRLTPADIEKVFADFDLVLDCTDNLAAKFLINDAAVLTRTPVIFASVYQYEGQLQVYSADESSPCLRCIWPEAGATVVPNCAETGVLGPVPGVFGTLQAMEAIKCLLDMPGTLGNQMLIFNLLTYQSRKIRSRKCTDCDGQPTCRRIADLRTLHPGDDPDLEVRFVSLSDARTQGYALIDIREHSEIAKEPLPTHADQQIPMAQLQKKLSDLEAGQKYLVICARGTRSKLVAQQLRREGLRQVYSLKGGASSLRPRVSA